MYTGLISYIVIGQFFPNPFGMQTIVTATALSIFTMVVVSYLSPAPTSQVIRKFWGTDKIAG